jgi:hypothetical protein
LHERLGLIVVRELDVLKLGFANFLANDARGFGVTEIRGPTSASLWAANVGIIQTIALSAETSVRKSVGGKRPECELPESHLGLGKIHLDGARRPLATSPWL